ncbi:MAG TPA: caspase family protein [Allosphingosinicella sp.]|nr:caspase family protein [Allosphingosinicella sp.]
MVVPPGAVGYSLHFGLNFVDPAHYDGWDGELRACEFDAHDMEAIAAAQGFAHRKVLLTADATSANLFTEMTGLARQMTAGDMLLLTYSGHGGQVEDVTSEEDDKMDETWCLYDRMVLDDELYRLFGLFKPGVRIFMLSDSCHSGTVMKFRMERGQDPAEAARAAARATRTGDDDVSDDAAVRLMPVERSMQVQALNRGLYTTVKALAAGGETQVPEAEVILISGCLDEQVSLDGSRNGVFTAAMRRVWNDGAFTGGYHTFHRQIVARMPLSQTPNLYVPHPVSPEFMNARPFTI